MKRNLPLPPPLHIFVLLLVLGLSLAYCSFQAVLMVWWQVDQIMERQVMHAEALATRFSQRLAPANPENRKTKLEADIATLGATPPVYWSLVCDAEGRVLFSSKAEWLGKLLPEVVRPEVVALGRVAATSSQLVKRQEGRDTILVAKRVPGALEQPQAYTVFIERDLRAAAERQRSDALYAAGASAAGFAVFCFILWGVLFLFLKQRMKEFLQHAGLDGKGTHAPQLLSGADEFSQIARLLSETEDMLKDIAAKLDEMIWIVSPSLEVKYLSPAFEQLFQRDRQQVMANGFAMPGFIHQECQPRLYEAFQTVIEGAGSLHLEFRATRGDGQLRWIECAGYAVRDAEGKLQRIVGISRDVTERKNLEQQIVSIAEQERHSIGHDLHDDACQRLAATKLKCGLLTQRLEREGSPHQAMARELTSQMGETSTLLRNIARGLAPVEVVGEGLMFALRKLVLTQEAIFEVPCFLIDQGTVIVSNRMVATHLYRIAQEFINNAARHGKPERIEVHLEALTDRVRLCVLNDGLPFQKPIAAHGGMGLKIVYYRARAIGATLSIRARSDGTPGTVAECVVPQDICQAANTTTTTSRAVDTEVFAIGDSGRSR